MLASALSEVISLGAVVPFIGILTAPEKVFNHTWIHGYAMSMGFTEPGQLILPITVTFALAAVGAGLVRLAMLWLSTRISFAIGTDLSIEIYLRTLYQPYSVHISRNSSEVISGITGKAWSSVAVIESTLGIVSSLVILVFVCAALVAIDPQVVLIAASIFSAIYLVTTLICRKMVRENSQCIAVESTKVIKILQEGLGGIRDVLLNGTQPVFVKNYRLADEPLRRASGANAFIAVSPRFVMEALGMVLVALLAYFIHTQTRDLTSAIPVIGALALGAQRLLPVAQIIYSKWIGVMGNKQSLADALELLDQALPSESTRPEPEPLDFEDSIVLKDLRFRYFIDGPYVIDGVSLVIRRGERVGFVGSTGSGKSTLLDLFMGLLEPSGGAIIVDGHCVNTGNVRAWQRCIAHVPQNIFLADSTLAENIAFGIDIDNINMDRVRHAAQKAQISNFIDSLRDGYESLVGERGVRLSGGQRQRIGIARALYREASVVVFDEATSALDNKTELAVMDSITSLDPELTVLLIAHRLTTVRNCDQIVEIEHGRIVATGNYYELIERSASFRRMAGSVA